MQQEAKKPSGISLGTDKITNVRSSSEYLDPKVLEEERKSLANELEGARVHITRTIFPQLPDKKSQNYWDRLNYKEDEIHNAEKSLEQKIESGPDAETRGAHYLSFILHAAGELLKFKNLQQQKKFAEKHGFSYLSDPYVQLSEFVYTPRIQSKIGGVSIKQAVDNPNIPPSSIYRFVIESRFVHSRLNYEKILEENQTPLTTMYPNFTKEAIHTVAGLTASFYFMTQESFDELLRDFLPRQEGTEKEIVTTAREMVNKTDRLRENVYMTILNPDSPEFPSLKEMVEKYLLEKDGDTQISTILSLGLISDKKVSAAYRKAKELAGENNENSAFYTKLTRLIREFVEEIPSEIEILTKDDLPSIIDPDISLDNVDIPTFENLREQTVAISQKSSRQEYSMGPQNADWKNLIPPTLVKIRFDETQPSNFGILIHYQNEDGESLSLELWFDTKKDYFNWCFLEAPNDPEMQVMRKAALLATQSILTDVQRQAEAEYQEKQKERQTKTQTPRTNLPKEPYVPREKIARQKRLRPLTPIQEILQGEMPFSVQPEQQRIKNQIVASSDEDLDKMMENLSFQDRELVIRGLEQYNERRVGQFKMLRSSGEEKEPLFTLRINTGKGGGGIRVLLRERRSENDSPNTHSFEIIAIGYRKDIYRKRGL